jgi:hypothetical protein
MAGKKLPLGTVGRVVHPNKGDWGKDYRVSGYDMMAPKGEDRLSVETVERLPADPKRPDNHKLPRESAESIPAEWFVPGQAAALEAVGKAADARTALDAQS